MTHDERRALLRGLARPGEARSPTTSAALFCGVWLDPAKPAHAHALMRLDASDAYDARLGVRTEDLVVAMIDMANAIGATFEDPPLAVALMELAWITMDRAGVTPQTIEGVIAEMKR